MAYNTYKRNFDLSSVNIFLKTVHINKFYRNCQKIQIPRKSHKIQNKF